MGAYIIRRFVQALLIVVIVTALVFITMRFMPGDPILIYLSREQYQSLSQEQIELTRHQFGLDKAIPLQYVDWLNGLVHGNLGTSLVDRKPVTKDLIDKLPVTLYLGIIAFIVGNTLGILAGLLCAIRRGKTTDLMVTLFANFGITVPSFWLAIIMIYFLSLKLGWFPTHGFTWPVDDFWLSVKQTVMPVICLAIFPLGGLARQTRSVMLEVIRQDYVRTAYSKGLRERMVLAKHVIKNGMIPVITLAGMQLPMILGGSVITETVFNISGMGRLAVNSIYSLDYPVTQAIVLIMAVMVVLSNFLVDVTYGWLDPRIRYG
jgi:peptide/nickel transport system permease protein